MAGTWTPDTAFWRHRSVIVTGATGFLGSHLVGLLVGLDAQVTILVRDEVPATSVSRPWIDQVTKVRGDVRDQAIMERLLGEYGAQTVFHLAAQSQVEVANRNPISTFEANVAGTWTVLEAARRSPAVAQVVVASSDKAYGDQPTLPYTENMALLGGHPYDVSKACADLLAQSFARTFGVPAAITRCGNFFGPGDTNWRRLVPGTIRCVLGGQTPVVRSDGSLTRDYLYVVDGALSYLRLAEALVGTPNLAGEAFNFSAERPLSVLGLVTLIQEAAGTSFQPDVQGKATHEISHQFLSAEKARRVLDWSPTFTLEGAMQRTVEWYRAELGRASAS
ncbi:MAG: NAD-dependent epimerase/dehydratase family protein [Acidimicrobiales bacterium]